MADTSGHAKLDGSELYYPIPRERKRRRPTQDNDPAKGCDESISNAENSSLSGGQLIQSFVDVDNGGQDGGTEEQPLLTHGDGAPIAASAVPDPRLIGVEANHSNSYAYRTKSDAGGEGTGAKLQDSISNNNNNNFGCSITNPASHFSNALGDARRMKQPTLAAYGMVSDTLVLKKELANRDAQLEELKDKLSEAATELLQQTSHIRAVEKRAVQLEAKLHRFQQAMRGEMTRVATQGRIEARRVLHQKHFELDQIVTWPGNSKQMWVEGSLMCGLIRQLGEVTKRRDEVEALKKAAHHNVKHLMRQDRDREESTPGQDSFDALVEAQEELQLRTAEHAALTNMVATIRQRRAEIDIEKKAFVKEIRRINDEDASEYISCSALGEGERYILMYLLGKGGFSEVWRAFDMLEGRHVACKIHHINRDWPMPTRQNYRRRAERELDIMRQLNHPHLTKLYHVFPLSETAFISVMEYSKGMDLDTYLKRYRLLKESDARLILLQVVGALRYLASLPSPVIHYDLKPANILLHSEDPSTLGVKIIDFGLSKSIGEAREGPSDNLTIEPTSQGTGTSRRSASKPARRRASATRSTSGPWGPFFTRCSSGSGPSPRVSRSARSGKRS